jgi:dTDP-4-dehydrorhamnose 3,5-epimerase
MAHEKTTFSEGPIEGVTIRSLARFDDRRGWLIELFREDELGRLPPMAYVSQTLPGVARGPHAHREQSDRFFFVGPGDFRLYLWDVRAGSRTFGHCRTLTAGESAACEVVIPPGVVHAYKNTSAVPGLAINCPDRLYAGPGRKEPVDEIRYEDLPDSPFKL